MQFQRFDTAHTQKEFLNGPRITNPRRQILFALEFTSISYWKELNESSAQCISQSIYIIEKPDRHHNKVQSFLLQAEYFICQELADL